MSLCFTRQKTQTSQTNQIEFLIHLRCSLQLSYLEGSLVSSNEIISFLELKERASSAPEITCGAAILARRRRRAELAILDKWPRRRRRRRSNWHCCNKELQIPRARRRSMKRPSPAATAAGAAGLFNCHQWMKPS